MGLRKDFLMHKKRTIESFGLVKADITGISIGIENLKNSVSSIEATISDLRKSVDNCLSYMDIQHNNNLNLRSKIDFINKSMGELSSNIGSIKNNISRVNSSSQRISSSLSSHGNSIKKLLSGSKAQSLKSKLLNYALVKSNKEIKKLKNLLNRKLRVANRKDAELEITIRKQRNSIIALNRKIESKKVIRKAARKKSKRAAPATKKTTKKTITPKKTVIEVKEQRIKK